MDESYHHPLFLHIHQ